MAERTPTVDVAANTITLGASHGLKTGDAVVYEASGAAVNWAAAIAWAATLVLCLAVVNAGGLQIYFVGLPGWFVAAFLYIVMSRLVQRKEVRS